MSLFDRRREATEAAAETLPEHERPYSLRPSPQGWRDRATAWPAQKLSRFEVLFPYPADAVEQLRNGLGSQPTEAALDAGFLAMQALRLPRGILPEYKGTYGAFLDWAEGYEGLPGFLGFKLVGTVAKDIGLELKACADPDLAKLGAAYLTRVLAITSPGVSIADVAEKQATAREVQEMMFARVGRNRDADPAPEEAGAVSGIAGPAPRAPDADPEDVIRVDEPVDRVPEPDTPGPGRRTAAAARDIRAAMSTPADPPPPEAPGDAAFPRGMRDADGPRKMTPRTVFQTLLEECLRDGKLTPMEMRALRDLRRQLGLDLAGHEEMLVKVQAQLARAAPETTQDLDPLVFFERLCWQAADDGKIEPAEQKMLQIVAGYLHVTAEEFAGIREKLVAARRGA